MAGSNLDAFRNPLLIIGLDLGDPEMLARWAREGSLPHLKTVMDRGFCGRTGGPEMICEHGVWVSLMSGISRAEHGYYYFQQLVPGSYDLRDVNRLHIKANPFWALLPKSMRAVVVDVPDAAPVPGLNGIQILDWATHYPVLPPTVLPEGETGRVRGIFGKRRVIHEEINSTPERDLVILESLIERVGQKGRLCKALFTERPLDVGIVVFSECHTASHQFWRYRNSQGAGTKDRLATGIKEVMQAIDRELGAICSLFPNPNVIVLSSTGIEDRFPTGGLTEAVCRGLGYQRSPAASIRSWSPLSVVRRTLPESLRDELSRFLPTPFQERLLAGKFRAATDWKTTQSFAIPSWYTGFVRVNLAGREPLGTVPLTEYEAILDRLEEDFLSLVDPESGEPAVQEVLRGSKFFGSGPHPSLPDLYVIWKSGTEWMAEIQSAGGPIRQPKPRFFRGSDHTRTGFVAACGPDIPRMDRWLSISPLDLVPTFFRLLGEPVPSLKGKPLPWIGK